jgi:hypothetical protein
MYPGWRSPALRDRLPRATIGNPYGVLIWRLRRKIDLRALVVKTGSLTNILRHKRLAPGGGGTTFPFSTVNHANERPVMKMKLLLSATVVFLSPLLAAQAGPADDVTAAAQKLGSESSYSWHTTVVVPPDSRFKPGPTDGKTAGGVTYVKMNIRGNDSELYLKGTNAVMTNPDGGWQTLADAAADDQGPGRFMVGMVRNFKTPAAQAAGLAADCQDLALTNGVYASALTADGTKKMLTMRRGGTATISNPAGTAQFWVANGELTKFEAHVTGTVSNNGNDMTVDRDTTVEITDVGTTKLDVPDDVAKLLP